MNELLTKLLPNVVVRLPELWQSVCDTLTMTLWSGIFIFVLGIFFGTLAKITSKGDIAENHIVYSIIDNLINIFRSIPFIILLTLVLPITRKLVGTGIGVKGAILPLVCGTVPFYARQIESALTTVSPGAIEAAKAMGLSNIAIIFKVYLREGLPAIARATVLTTISLIGLTTMAGAVGAGGLGNFAIMYGHNRFMTDITFVTVIIMIVFVCLVQLAGSFIVKKTSH